MIFRLHEQSAMSSGAPSFSGVILRKRVRVAQALVWLLLALAALFAGYAQAASDSRIGVLAYRGAEEAERSWQTTFDTLSRALPQYRIQVVSGTAAFLTAAVAAHRLDFLITNPGHYLELKVDYSAAALAT